MPRIPIIMALAVVGTLAVTAVGSATPPSARTAGKSQKNIVQTAVAAGQFKTLVSLRRAKTLNGEPVAIRVRAGRVYVAGAR